MSIEKVGGVMKTELILKLEGAMYYAQKECSDILDTMKWDKNNVALEKRFEQHYNNYVYLSNWIDNLETGTNKWVPEWLQVTMFSEYAIRNLEEYENEV